MYYETILKYKDSKYKKCKWCKSIYVCWNAFHPGYNYFNALMSAKFRFWKVQNWMHECWDCSGTFITAFKVKYGIPKDKLKSEFKDLPRHLIEGIRDSLYWAVSQCKYYNANEKELWNKITESTIMTVREFYSSQWELDHTQDKSKDEESL